VVAAGKQRGERFRNNGDTVGALPHSICLDAKVIDLCLSFPPYLTSKEFTDHDSNEYSRVAYYRKPIAARLNNLPDITRFRKRHGESLHLTTSRFWPEFVPRDAFKRFPILLR
jgi:hypothetical protein